MERDKQLLLKNLQQNIYCRLGRSKIEGVGVVAIKNIPKGANPFVGSKYQKHIGLTERELATLDKQIREMVEGFFVPEENKYWVPKNGLNNIDISYYMNHTPKPNVYFNDKLKHFLTKRPIKAGEELTISYDKF